MSRQAHARSGLCLRGQNPKRPLPVGRLTQRYSLYGNALIPFRFLRALRNISLGLFEHPAYPPGLNLRLK